MRGVYLLLFVVHFTRGWFRLEVVSDRYQYETGSDVSIVCKSEANTSSIPVSINWNVYGAPNRDYEIETSKTNSKNDFTKYGIITTYSSLYIKNITMEHSGIYLCQAKYMLGDQVYGAMYDYKTISVDNQDTKYLDITAVWSENGIVGKIQNTTAVDLSWETIGDIGCIFGQYYVNQKCHVTNDDHEKLALDVDGYFLVDRSRLKNSTMAVYNFDVCHITALDETKNLSQSHFFMADMQLTTPVSIFAPRIVPNDSFNTTCIASPSNVSKILTLKFTQNTIIESSICPGIYSNESSASHQQTFKFETVNTKQPISIFSTLHSNVSGKLECIGSEWDGTKSASSEVCINNKVYIEEAGELEQLEVEEGDDFQLTCVGRNLCSGQPFSVTWEFDLTPDDYEIEESNCSVSLRLILKIKQASNSTSGLYTCVQHINSIENLTETFSSSINVTIVKRTVRLKTSLFNVFDSLGGPSYPRSIYTFALLLVFIVAVIVVVIFVYFRRRNKLRKLMYSDRGEVNELCELHEQKQLINVSLESNWEFPRSQLKIGKQIGKGNFGFVYEAEAGYIVNGEHETKLVAVKQSNRTTDVDAYQAMLKELQIMKRVSGHKNIVNLLGYVEDKSEKHELLIMVEFCPFGNMHDYLIRNMRIYGTLGEEDQNKENKIMPFNEEVLKNWALQVSEGMYWLEANNVIHGDLATRNILVCHNNIVKISDFGLSKHLRYESVYEKRKECELPWQWLAPEALLKLHFSTKSDVWAYGIVLWEMFTFGRRPYLGMGNALNLRQHLENGLRLEKPECAPQVMYDVMMKCWEGDPEKRPTFEEILHDLYAIMPRSLYYEIPKYLRELKEVSIANVANAPFEQWDYWRRP